MKTLQKTCSFRLDKHSWNSRILFWSFKKIVNISSSVWILQMRIIYCFLIKHFVIVLKDFVKVFNCFVKNS